MEVPKFGANSKSVFENRREEPAVFENRREEPGAFENKRKE